jgi:dTDP-4-amino-4,6-dideoxygalactose transaminase
VILLNEFKAEPQLLRDSMLAAVSRVLESGWYVLGKEVEAFERQWADACGVSHAVGVANGTDAIEIALRALGIGPGDEVITTPMTAFATVLAIIRAGATPVLADIEAETALLSIDSAKRCLSLRTKAVVIVHLYGQVRDMPAWQRFCAQHGIALVEDCAQAHLATLGGQVAGSFGRVGTWSFYPTKNLGAPGDAGAITTDDTKVAERARRLRNYGQTVRYHHMELGMNSRLDELQAAILGERLKWLERFTARRREIARSYLEAMHNPLVRLLAQPTESSAHVYHLFVVTCPQRQALQVHLQKREVQSLIHYPIPVHHQEPCHEIRRDPEGLTTSERHAASCLSLPSHPQMSDAAVRAVIDAVNTFQND